ncbi:hypothetical protein ABPG74_011503 [Tetrahymena malaccensis]
MKSINQLDNRQKLNLEQVKEMLLRKANILVLEFFQKSSGKISSAIVQDQATQEVYTLLIFPLLNKQGIFCQKKLAYAQQRSQILQELNHPNIMKFYGSFQLHQYFFVQLEKFGQIAVKWCEYYQEFLFYKILVSNIALQVLNVFKYLQYQNLCVDMLSDLTVFINDMHQIKIWDIRKKQDFQDYKLQSSQDLKNKKQKTIQNEISEFSQFIQIILEKQKYLGYYEPLTQHKCQISLIENIKEQSVNSQKQIEKLICQYGLILKQQLDNLDENQIHQIVKLLLNYTYSFSTQKVDFIKDALITCGFKSKYKIKNSFLVCKILLDQGKFSDALQYINLIFEVNNKFNMYQNRSNTHLHQINQTNHNNLDLESLKSLIQNVFQNKIKKLQYLKGFQNLSKFGYENIQDLQIYHGQYKINKIYLKNQNIIDDYNSSHQIFNEINIFKIITDDGQNSSQNIAQLYNSLSKQSVLLNDQNEQYRKYLAELYFQNNDFKSQIKCLQICYKASQNIEILNNITDSLIKLNLFEMAKQICLYQISLNRNDFNALLKLGIIYLELKNLQKAKMALDRCVNINHSNLEPYLYISFYFFRKQHYFRSIQNLLKFSQDKKLLPQKRNIIKMNHAIISKKLKETYNIYQSEIRMYKNFSDVQSGYLYLYPDDNKYDQNENIHNEISQIDIQSDQSQEQEDEQSDSEDENSDAGVDNSEIDCSYEQRQQNQSDQSSQTVQKEIQKNFYNQNKQLQENENQTKYVELVKNQIDPKIHIKDHICNLNESMLLLTSFKQEQQDDHNKKKSNLNTNLIEESQKKSLEKENLNEIFQKSQQKKQIQEEKNEQLDFPNRSSLNNLMVQEGFELDQKLNIENIQIQNNNPEYAIYRQNKCDEESSQEQETDLNYNKNDQCSSNQSEMKIDIANQNQINEIIQDSLEDNNHQSSYYQSILNLNFQEQQQTLENYSSITAQQQFDDEIENQQNSIQKSCNLENKLFQDLDIHNFLSLQSIEGQQSPESTSNSCRIHVNDLEKVF